MSYERIKKNAWIVAFSLISIFLVCTFVLLRNAPNMQTNHHYDLFVAFQLYIGSLLLVVSWVTTHIVFSFCVLLVIILSVILIVLSSQYHCLGCFMVFYILLWGMLFAFNRRKRLQTLETVLGTEHATEEKNKTTIAIDEISNALEAYLNRYSNYFNLREVANKFSTSLSLKKLPRLVVEQTLAVVKKGDACLLYLCNQSDRMLSLVASESFHKDTHIRPKFGTIFDHWVVKSAQHLIITDAAKDFRFDCKDPALESENKSLIAAPIIHDDSPIGVIRMISKDEDCFNTDDLRILNIMAILASSAIGNAILYQQTEELAIRDSLTSLYVQRYFKERLKEEHRRSLLMNSHLSLLMCDIDHFKRYNDQYGHAAGDIVLCAIAQIFLDLLGKDALVARYGGEEFIILLPDIPKYNALEIAEELRKRAAAHIVDLRGVKTKVTLSVGVSSLPEETLDCEDLIVRADRKLYKAKKQGRNRVC